MRLLVLPVLALLSGCIHMAECATHGGSAWTEVTSTHFVVRSNLPGHQAELATRELERALAGLRSAFGRLRVPARPLDVVLLSDAFELQELLAKPFVAGAMVGDDQELMVVADDDDFLSPTADHRLLMHELTHFLLHRTLQRMPRWLNEGLASYFETVKPDWETNTFVRGVSQKDYLRTIARWRPVAVDELWAWTGDADTGPNALLHRYSSAWFWVWFLANTRPAALNRLVTSLEAGEEPRPAWDAAVRLSSPELLAEAEVFLQASLGKTHIGTLAPADETRVTRALPDAEAHLWLSRAADAAGAKARARREAAAAFELAPSSPLVLEQRARLEAEPAERQRLAKLLTDTAPERSDSWVLLASTYSADAPERAAAFERALTLAPRDARTRITLALCRVRAKRLDEAGALAEQALADAPVDPHVLTGYAAVRAAQNRCAEAVTAQRQGIEHLPHATSAQVRERLTQGVQHYLSCAEASPRPAER